MIGWMVWATFVTVLLGAAGAAVERGLRLLGRQARWAWIAGTVAALALMAWAWLTPASPRAAGGYAVGLEAIAAEQARDVSMVVPAAPGVLELLEPWMAAAWAVSSALLSMTMLVGLTRLASRARRWPTAVVASSRVLVSEGFGPALVGVLAPRIVMPSWALGLGADRLRMACAHEAEHRRTGDGLVLLASALVTAALPWNAGLWWIQRRLRTAVEVDCDARVLRGGADPVAYGSLLLELGMRSRNVPPMVAAFARPRPTLERRMMMIVKKKSAAGAGLYARVIGAAALAGVLVVAACETPEPTALADTPTLDGEAVRVGESDASAEAAGVLHRRGEGTFEVREIPFGDRQPLLDRHGDGASTFHLRETPSEGAVAFDEAFEAAESGRNLRFRPSDEAGGPAPLIYVDGVRIRNGALSEIEPDRIDRIEVIKGVAAIGLYGEEAAGGVVQIFLK